MTPCEAALKGKEVVALYFSAHWCPPCRIFTPQLADAYKGLAEAGRSFEVVFISSDRGQGEFDGYFQEMPWLALPFAQRGAARELSKEFSVSGIPSLILLHGETGEVISTNGRGVVLNDPSGAHFPWTHLPGSQVKERIIREQSEGGFDVERGASAYAAHWDAYMAYDRQIKTLNKVVYSVHAPTALLFLVLGCQHMSTPCEAGFASLLVIVGLLVFVASVWNLFKLTPMGQVETLKRQIYLAISGLRCIEI